MAKNKIKVKKSVSNRFRVTKKGKVMRGSKGLSHLRSKNSKRKLRRMTEPKQLEGKFAKKVKQMLTAA